MRSEEKDLQKSIWLKKAPEAIPVSRILTKGRKEAIQAEDLVYCLCGKNMVSKVAAGLMTDNEIKKSAMVQALLRITRNWVERSEYIIKIEDVKHRRKNTSYP